MTQRHKAFCEEYVKDHNGQKAAERAGYAPKSARVQASTLLTNQNIKDYIQQLETEIYNRNMMTADEVLQSLADLARNGKAEGTRVKALDLLGKYHALYIDRIRNEGEMVISIVPPTKPENQSNENPEA